MGRKKKPKKDNYFGPEIDIAIDKYCNTNDNIEKNRIYKNTIFPALKQLSQNVFYNRKICYYDDTPANAILDCVVFMTERLGKYDITQNTNSFSYFNRTAINFFIQMSQRCYNKIINVDKLTVIDKIRDFDEEETKANRNEELNDFLDMWIPYMEKNSKRIFNNKELPVIYAVLTIFKERKNIDIDKKQIYLLIREMTKCKTTIITPIMKRLKIYFFRMFEEYKDVFYSFHPTAWDYILKEGEVCLT